MKITLASIIIGGLLILAGLMGFDEARKSKADPALVDITALENNDALDNIFITVGEHYALYDALIFEYPIKQGEEPTATTEIRQAYYPIASTPVNRGRIHVLVKTNRFKRVGDIVGGTPKEASITGMVMNDYESLGFNEKKVLKDNISEQNFDDVLILWEGMKPRNVAQSKFLFGAGILLSLFGIYWFFSERKRRKRLRGQI